MKSFPKDTKFCYEWRSYQARVLAELDEHLENNHLHLVAPPGSGKTVLGLEVMLRLNQPTLIIAPTIAIRNQWADRFMELFLQVDKRPEWISTNIRQPAFMTITTYQGLHSLFSKTTQNEETTDDELVETETTGNNEEALKRIDQLGFRTLILDEAHHLRTAWWRTTIQFRDQLHNPSVVALTATPPYDVGLQEWNRYIDLCGPIDAEIQVPELIREAELCPHQDYLYMSLPTRKESEPIVTFRKSVETFRENLVKNSHFISLLEQHPWITKTNEYIEEILARPAYFSSMLIFLKAAGSETWLPAFQSLYENERSLPSLDLEWLEELCTGILFQDDSVEDPLLNDLKKRLSRMGAIERRKVMLRSTTALNRSLVNSTSKLTSIQQIVEFEAKTLGDQLRLVILADYIHLPDLPKSAGDEKPIMRLGVIPIFEHLRRNFGSMKLGVLTGSIVILPTSSMDLFKTCAGDVPFKTEPLAFDPNFTKVEMTAASRQKIVSIITEVFTKGGMQVLVGTTALLGEGWDAPSINALIIASYVGTFMLSNQMRGRAIRTEKGNPGKTANIWHLVCIDEGDMDGGHDFQSLSRRFRSLMGIHMKKETISTGIERLHLLPPPYSRDGIQRQNEMMFAQASRRDELFERWNKAVLKDGKKTEVMQADKQALPRPFLFENTLKATLIMGAMMFFSILNEVLEGSTKYQANGKILLIIGLVIGTAAASPFLYKAGKIFFRNATIEKNMIQVAEAVYQTLFHIGLIQTKLEQNLIRVERDEMGIVTCWLETGSTHEQKLFLQALQEVVDPIENPRYLLYREAGKRFLKRFDYHAVPEEIGRRKEHAEFFLKEWVKRLGKAELIYTRNPEGRKTLLKARIKAMSGAFVKKSERLSEWR